MLEIIGKCLDETASVRLVESGAGGGAGLFPSTERRDGKRGWVGAAGNDEAVHLTVDRR